MISQKKDRNDLVNFSLARDTILITGGSGSWGQELTRQLLDNYDPVEIRIYSRGEPRQVEMKRRFQDDRIKYIIGDVRDLSRLKQVTRGVDCVFHLAALKHVPVCEENPWETVHTNIVGTQNIIEAASENNVKKVVDVSSDKAADPLSLYGITKVCGEKLIIAANNLDSKTSFVCIRAGNVLGTSGSVVPLFKEQINKLNEVTVTDRNMSRFFMSLNQAIKLVLKATSSSIGGEIFVTKMPAVNILELAKVMIRRLGNRKTAIRFIGARPGEKIYESLVTRDEARRAYELGDYFIVLPHISMPRLDKLYKHHYSKLQHVNFQEYTSISTDQLQDGAIGQLLESDGWFKEKAYSDALKYLETLDKSRLKKFFKSEGWVRINAIK